MKSAFLSNIHTHSTFCDGKASPAEMAKAAHDLGFVSLGFSGHAPLPYENDWAIRMEELPRYHAAVRDLKKQYEEKMEIYLGIELDSDSRIDLSPYDYVIGSLHTLHKDGKSFPVDAGRSLLAECRDTFYDGDFHALMRDYYEKLYDFVKNQHFDVLGHFDLPLKYNKSGTFIDEDDKNYQKTALEALDGILDLRPDLIVEINTGGILRAGRPYPYPCPALLSRLKERGARMTLTADAHYPEGMAAAYDDTAELLWSLGIRELWRLQGGRFVIAPV